MPDTISRQGATAREFAELICADPAWLRAEFEAIVAAGFGAAPVLQRGGSSRHQNPRQATVKRQAAKSLWRAWPPEHRERSPPLRSETR